MTIYQWMLSENDLGWQNSSICYASDSRVMSSNTTWSIGKQNRFQAPPHTHHSCVLTTKLFSSFLFMNATSLNFINNLSRIWPFPCCNVVTKCKWAQIQTLWLTTSSVLKNAGKVYCVSPGVWAHWKTRTWLVTSDNTLHPESHLNFTNLQTWCFHYFANFLSINVFHVKFCC